MLKLFFCLHTELSEKDTRIIPSRNCQKVERAQQDVSFLTATRNNPEVGMMGELMGQVRKVILSTTLSARRLEYPAILIPGPFPRCRKPLQMKQFRELQPENPRRYSHFYSHFHCSTNGEFM
jgi:hypothetical protein